MEDIEILTVTDVMQILRVSRHTAEKIMKQKNFPRISGTRKLLVEKQAFLHWLRNEEYQIKK